MSDHTHLKSLLDSFIDAEEAHSSHLIQFKRNPSPDNPVLEEVSRTHMLMMTLRPQIVAALITLPAIPNLRNQRHRDVISRLTGDCLTHVEEKADHHNEHTFESIPPDEESDTWNFVYANGTPYETYLRYLSFPPLVTAVPLPDEIVTLIEEARRSYAWGHTLAALVVGRMILECGMNDIGQRIGLFRARRSLDDSYRDYPPGKRANDLFGGPKSERRQEFRRLYDIGSSVVHTNSLPKLPWPPKYIGDVILFLVSEYESHGSQIQAREGRRARG